jgi:uncharacterized protein (DUF305 family)
MRQLLGGRSGAVRRCATALSALVLTAAGFTAGAARSVPDAPDESSVDVGFVRDMSVHHAQAVTLGKLAARRATLPAVREMGEDIVLAQQREIGVMAGWLQQWRLPSTTDAPAMVWMSHGGTAFVSGGDPPMPGMATREEVARLAVARGPARDLLFCRLMLRHHLGGMHMISEVIDRGERPEVVALARQMRADQAREVVQLQRLLRRLDPPGSGSFGSPFVLKDDKLTT